MTALAGTANHEAINGLSGVGQKPPDAARNETSGRPRAPALNLAVSFISFAKANNCCRSTVCESRRSETASLHMIPIQSPEAFVSTEAKPIPAASTYFIAIGAFDGKKRYFVNSATATTTTGAQVDIIPRDRARENPVETQGLINRTAPRR